MDIEKIQRYHQEIRENPTRMILYSFVFGIVLAGGAFVGSIFGKLGESVVESQLTEVTSIEKNIKVTDFEKYFKGTIGRYKIRMYLRCSEGKMEGSYYYTRHGTHIRLLGTFKENGQLSLLGYSNGEKVDRFEGELKNGIVHGSWHKPDGSRTLDFKMAETDASSY